MKQEIASVCWDMGNKQQSTMKEILYHTNEFGLYFTNGRKLVKCFKQEVQTGLCFRKIALVPCEELI